MTPLINMSPSLIKHNVNIRECHKNADKNAAFVITLFLIQPVSNELQYGISLSVVIKSYCKELNGDNSNLS